MCGDEKEEQRSEGSHHEPCVACGEDLDDAALGTSECFPRERCRVLYVKRGYVPDGRGVTYGDRFVQEGETMPFDDSLVRHFTKAIEG